MPKFGAFPVGASFARPRNPTKSGDFPAGGHRSPLQAEIWDVTCRGELCSPAKPHKIGGLSQRAITGRPYKPKFGVFSVGASFARPRNPQNRGIFPAGDHRSPLQAEIWGVPRRGGPRSPAKPHKIGGLSQWATTGRPNMPGFGMFPVGASFARPPNPAKSGDFPSGRPQVAPTCRRRGRSLRAHPAWVVYPIPAKSFPFPCGAKKWL